MVEVIGDHRGLAEGTPPGIVVTNINHAFPGGIFAKLPVQLRPVAAVFLGIDPVIESVQLRMVLVNPVQDDRPIVSGPYLCFQNLNV